jgi:hypothetical protein
MVLNGPQCSFPNEKAMSELTDDRWSGWIKACVHHCRSRQEASRQFGSDGIDWNKALVLDWKTIRCAGYWQHTLMRQLSKSRKQFWDCTESCCDNVNLRASCRLCRVSSTFSEKFAIIWGSVLLWESVIMSIGDWVRGYLFACSCCICSRTDFFRGQDRMPLFIQILPSLASFLQCSETRIYIKSCKTSEKVRKSHWDHSFEPGEFRSFCTEILVWMQLLSEYNIQKLIIYHIQMVHEYLAGIHKEIQRGDNWMRVHKSQHQLGRREFDDPLLTYPCPWPFTDKDASNRISDVMECLTWLQRDIWSSTQATGSENWEDR